MATPDPIAGLREDVQTLTETAAELVKARQTDRKALKVAMVAVGLVIATIITVVVLTIAGYDRLHCQNNALTTRQSTTESFLLAERKKVQGQVDGLIEIRDAMGDQAKGLEGFNRFISASQHYLGYVNQRLDKISGDHNTQC